MPRRRAHLGASLVLAVLPGLGCSAPVGDMGAEDVADASSGLTQGIIVVEHETAPEATQTSVSAKFMRIAPAVEADSAERLVGSRLEQPAVGACMVLGGPEDVPSLPRSSHAAIELLDVGELELQVEATEVSEDRSLREPMWLATRAFPDVGDLVSGVFYTSRDDAAELPTGSYVVSASGSAQVDHFEIVASGPPDLDDVRVEDELLTDGPIVEAGQPLTIRWTKDERATAEDRILVDVAGTNGATLRCGFADVGEGTLPASALAERALGALPAAATIEVHRIRRAFFGTPAIDAGEMRFDVSVLGRVIVDRAAE